MFPSERSSKRNSVSDDQSRRSERSMTPRDYADESLLLTGDLSIADVEWVVQYKSKTRKVSYSLCGIRSGLCATFRNP